MALDEKVKESVIQAVSKNNQSNSVAKKIVNLLEEISNGTANLDNPDSIKEYLKVIVEAVEIEP